MHIVVNGVSVEAELKGPGGRPSELQVQKINQIDASGCIGLVLYPKHFENFKRMILYIKKHHMIPLDVVTYSGLERGWK